MRFDVERFPEKDVTQQARFGLIVIAGQDSEARVTFASDSNRDRNDDGY